MLTINCKYVIIKIGQKKEVMYIEGKKGIEND
jgi:hypothetical protein